MTKTLSALTLNKAASFFADAGIKVVLALVLLVVGFKAVSVAADMIDKSKAYSKMDANVRGFLKSFTVIALKVFLFIAAATVVGIPMTSVIAVLGSLGLAIGLAFQGSFSNVAGGLIILIFKPFKVGDFIDTPSGQGTVSDISIFYTKLTTPDNKKIIVPNGSVSNSALINVNSNEIRRVDFNVCASYDADVEQVKSALLNIAESHPLILKDPAPLARLNELADSSLNYAFWVWCKSSDYFTVKFDINEQIINVFGNQKIGIPYPQVDVHLSK